MLKIAEINAAMRQITDLVNATCGKRPIITALSCHFNPNLTDGGLDPCVFTRNTYLEMIQDYLYFYIILT